MLNYFSNSPLASAVEAFWSSRAPAPVAHDEQMGGL
jgi:hypothetical protein